VQEELVTYRGWEYATQGDYHRVLDPNWPYALTYRRKMAHVRRVIRSVGPGARMLDVGCGEGLLVEDFGAQGFRIEGIDLHYESDHVRRGSVLDLPYPDASLDLVLLLDVFEHLSFQDQPAALAEIARVLVAGGRLIATIPNLAHWNSRFSFALFGRLDRTDVETEHVGERPLTENRRLLEAAGLHVESETGITLTVPLLYRRVICRWPARMRWLHDALDRVASPPLSMLTLFQCRKLPS
jgi:SAM-dependent methyltransferase